MASVRLALADPKPNKELYENEIPEETPTVSYSWLCAVIKTA